MGCDIHMRVEWKPYTFDSTEPVWADGDHYMRNRWYDGEDEDEKEFEVIPIYSSRNYALFAQLADVRNNGLIEPISEPKGVPTDCCESVMKEIERWDCDGHSHSYFTLRELIEWEEQSDHIVTFKGMISAEQARQLDVEGKTPDSWCAWTNAEGYVYREWSEKVDFIGPIIESLKKRAKELFFRGNEEELAERIRIVFWFDN